MLWLIACLTLWTTAFEPARADEIDSFDVTVQAFKILLCRSRRKFWYVSMSPDTAFFATFPLFIRARAATTAWIFTLMRSKTSGATPNLLSASSRGGKFRCASVRLTKKLAGNTFT